MTSLAHAAAAFGPLIVEDRNGVRYLTLNGQVQGGAYLKPGADVVRAGLRGPGPIPASSYTAGWLIAGAVNPKAKVLMVGLGSGTGAVAMLYNFPGVTIDVVEVDPVMVEHALEWFPLTAHYVETGRLRIHVADAKDFVSQQENKKWDLLLSDGYTGGNHLAVGARDHNFYHDAHRCCGEIWLNWIGVPNGFRMMKEFDALHAEGWSPETTFIPGLKPYPDLSRPRNWILTSEIPDAEAVDAFRPFAAMDEQDFQDDADAAVAVDTIRQCWTTTLDSQLGASELAGVNLALA
jgi:hypothetical protein